MELEGVIEQLNYLQGVSCQIVDHFSNVSRSINGIQFTILQVTLALDELKQDLAKREAQLAALDDAYAVLSRTSSVHLLEGGYLSGHGTSVRFRSRAKKSSSGHGRTS